MATHIPKMLLPSQMHSAGCILLTNRRGSCFKPAAYHVQLSAVTLPSPCDAKRLPIQCSINLHATYVNTLHVRFRATPPTRDRPWPVHHSPTVMPKPNLWSCRL
jgi:hypothetical protein